MYYQFRASGSVQIMYVLFRGICTIPKGSTERSTSLSEINMILPSPSDDDSTVFDSIGGPTTVRSNCRSVINTLGSGRSALEAWIHAVIQMQYTYYRSVITWGTGPSPSQFTSINKLYRYGYAVRTSGTYRYVLYMMREAIPSTWIFASPSVL